MPTPVATPADPAAGAVDQAAAARRLKKPLLTKGNEKLGNDIYSWSIPHGRARTCPGATNTCTKICYVSRYTRRFKLDYKANEAFTHTPLFVPRMAKEASWKRVVRIHVSGDFYDAAYVRRWIEVIKRCPLTLFYAYTRSWRAQDVPLLEALIELSRLPNMALNISTDRDTGVPTWLFGAFGGSKRITYLAANDRDIPRDSDGQPTRVNIVFRHLRSTVMGKLGGSTVCPVENGIQNPVTCQTCTLCFKP